MEIGAGPVEQADDGGVDVPHLVGACRAQPTFGFAGCTRSRGRRQPYVRTRWYQVDGEAQTVAEPLREDGERAGRDVPVVRRGHHGLDHPDLSERQSMRRRARTGRLVVERTRRLPSSPRMEPTRRHPQEPQQRPQRDVRAGPD